MALRNLKYGGWECETWRLGTSNMALIECQIWRLEPQIWRVESFRIALS